MEAVGPGARTQDGTMLPMTLKEGDEVILPMFGGQEFKVDDDEYVLLRENDIIATVTK